MGNIKLTLMGMLPADAPSGQNARPTLQSEPLPGRLPERFALGILRWCISSLKFEMH